MAKWLELVASLSGKPHRPNPETGASMERLEQALGSAVPSELRSFVLEHGSLQGEYEETLIWSASEIDRATANSEPPRRSASYTWAVSSPKRNARSMN
jgi:hypothetical protein